jgi:hypothetical protein
MIKRQFSPSLFVIKNPGAAKKPLDDSPNPGAKQALT